MLKVSDVLLHSNEVTLVVQKSKTDQMEAVQRVMLYCSMGVDINYYYYSLCIWIDFPQLRFIETEYPPYYRDLKQKLDGVIV